MITLHHLDYSRGHRVLWLFEELGLPYTLVRYPRDAAFRAPPELRAVHPLGKSPVIVDGDLVLAKSAVILTYVDQRHGGGRLAPPAGSDAWFHHEEWLQFAESTAALPILILRLAAIAGGPTEQLEAFVTPTLGRILDQVEVAVRDKPFLTGPTLTLADIQIVYPLAIARAAGQLAGHPAILAYLDRLADRPAFARAIAAGGPMLPPPRT